MRRAPRGRVLVVAGVIGVAVAACGSAPPVTTSPPTTWPPSSAQDVEFVGVDEASGLAAFRRMVQEPAAHGANLIPDPQDTRIHRLPIAPGTAVTSVDPCSAEAEMAAVISHDRGAFYAHIHVDARHRIDEIRESAY